MMAVVGWMERYSIPLVPVWFDLLVVAIVGIAFFLIGTGFVLGWWVAQDGWGGS